MSGVFFMRIAPHTPDIRRTEPPSENIVADARPRPGPDPINRMPRFTPPIAVCYRHDACFATANFLLAPATAYHDLRSAADGADTSGTGQPTRRHDTAGRSAGRPNVGIRSRSETKSNRAARRASRSVYNDSVREDGARF